MKSLVHFLHFNEPISKVNKYYYISIIMKVSQIYDASAPPYLYIVFNSGKELDVYAYTSKNYGYRDRLPKNSKAIRQSQKLSLTTLLSKIKELCDDAEKKILTSKLKPILQKLGVAADRTRGKLLNWKTYDLWKEIEKHVWVKAGRPDQKALDWYKKTISTNKDYHLRGMLLRQGFLYTYNYDTPKYKDVLDFYDTQPLVISFGPIETKLGRRDIGINLHLFPPRIRKIIMYKIFEMYRNHYREQLFAKTQKVVNVTWKSIAAPLFKYGIQFGVRMYIPDLRRNAIEFKYEDWSSAIFLPSKKIEKVTQEELERLWAKFVREQKLKNGPGKGLNESWKNS